MTFTTSLVGLEAAALVVILYAMILVVYNLYFHPLRNIPGPRLAAASHFPFIVNRSRGHQIRWIKKLHEQYGEVVRIAPRQLSFISVDAWKDIYGHRMGGKPPLPKDMNLYGPDLVGSNGITRAHDEDHARQRRLLAHAFSEKALYEHQPSMQKHIDILIKKLDKCTSEGVDMSMMYNFCLFDIIADIAFGASLNMLENPDYHPWALALHGAIKSFALLPAIKASYPLLGTIIRRILVPPKLSRELNLHGEFTRHLVDTRLENRAEGQDIWSVVLRYDGDEKGINLNEMYAIGGVVMGAGSESPSTLLSGLTYFLLSNPDKMAVLSKEIRGAFTDPSEMDASRLAQLPFLRACIQEALRLYPPAPSGMPRVVPPGGTIISGRLIAAGTTVFVSPFSAHRMKAHFNDPDSFAPERWLEKPEEKYANDVLDSVQPFLYGPRNCIGKNLAHMVIRRIMANILWNYDLELCPESMNWDDQLVYVNWVKPPLMCSLKPVIRN